MVNDVLSSVSTMEVASMEQQDRSRRPSEVKRLTKLLLREDPKFAICSISGPGGVGKTYLLNHVLSAYSPSELGYMYLKVDGSNPEKLFDFFGLIADQLAARSLPAPAVTGRDYFPATRRVAVLHQKLVKEYDRELDKRGVDPEAKRAAMALVKVAHHFNDMLPGRNHPVRGVLRALTEEGISTPVIEAASELLSSLEVLERKSTILPEPIRDRLGISRKDRVRRDLFNLTSDVLVQDIENALDGQNRQTYVRLLHPPIKELNQLLLVFDDYEANSPVLGDFLVGSLIPRLAKASFRSTLIICCRDDLTSTNMGWAQHVEPHLKEDIRLKPFDKETAFALMADAGVPKEKWDGIFLATEGYPFLLTLAIEEATSAEGQTALFAKKFYERTARWMTPIQKEWFNRVCYLDDVNEDTLQHFFTPDEARDVQNWFENEASIRDPNSQKFCVRRFIRERTCEYLAMRSPSRHREMREKATGAMECLKGIVDGKTVDTEAPET